MHRSLTLEQAERLEMLAEEAGEIVQACTKVLRHGYNSYNPFKRDAGTNKQMLVNEVLDLLCVLRAMEYCGDVSSGLSIRSMVSVQEDNVLLQRWLSQKLTYTHYQADREDW